MQVRVVTLRYSEGIQGFPEETLRQVTAGRQVLEVREHFFVHGNTPHLALTLLLADADGGAPRRRPVGPDPGETLPEYLRSLYRDLRQWRNERARADGLPSYAIARNAQLAEICRRLPRTLAALKEIEGIGEKTCEKYGRDILGCIPKDLKAHPPQAAADENGAKP